VHIQSTLHPVAGLLHYPFVPTRLLSAALAVTALVDSRRRFASQPLLQRAPLPLLSMFIKELIIDGFKSYANRTVVSGWDQSFNAITGLNGTGKSNCLDAICFVLGISNLAAVRAQNMQELIYKQGQSRVNRASVTIVFDNSDVSKSPIGHEGMKEITITRQIVVGGRGKYLINGHTAQINRVQNLFHSVGLNVNNPHFLIMQGRITKVCNMKPMETLGLIEEVSGSTAAEERPEHLSDSLCTVMRISDRPLERPCSSRRSRRPNAPS
jgi:chromosome segregation ATPase